MNLWDAISFALLCGGVLFFATGTLGLFRFPDLHCRLHALTKADNLGLGLIAAALAMRAADPSSVFKMILTWLSVLVASASVCFLIANAAMRRDEGEGSR